MKRVLSFIFATLLFAVSQLSAHTFSVGGAFGVGHGNMRTLISPNKNAGGQLTHETKHDLSVSGFSGGLFANWRSALSLEENPTHAGLELAVDFSSQKGKTQSLATLNNQIPLELKYCRQLPFQLVGLLGTKFANIRTDMRLGYDNSQFKMRTNGNEIPYKINVRKGSFLLGFGLAAEITPQVSIGLTYDYIFHGKIKMTDLSVRGTGGLNNAGDKVDFKLKPRTGIAKLRLSYMF